MIRAIAARSAGSLTVSPADRVLLDYDDRHRRRIAMRGEGGLEFLLDLPEATALRHGDALVLDDGRMVEIVARPEPLLEIKARDAHHLARLAWHIGNRHIPAGIEATRILIRPDHVIAAMLAGLGAEVAEIAAAFDPEGGAYADGAHAPAEHDRPHAHDHGHGHAHHRHG